MTSQMLWYVARAGGIVAWGLAASSVVWGLALSTHVLGRKPRPTWLFDLHRFLGGLALAATLIQGRGLPARRTHVEEQKPEAIAEPLGAQ